MRYMYRQLERLFKLSRKKAHFKKEIKHSELKIESSDSKINRNMSDYFTTYIIYLKKTSVQKTKPVLKWQI